MPGSIYSQKGSDVYVSLFVGSEVEMALASRSRVHLTQKAGYLWKGAVTMTVEPRKKGTSILKVRVPGWMQSMENPYGLYRLEIWSAVSLKVNGESVPLKIFRGYVEIRRKWGREDQIGLILPAQPHLVTANGAAVGLQDRVTTAAGPFAHCLGGCDSEGLADLRAGIRSPLSITFKKGLLNEISVVKGQTLNKIGKKILITVTPYYALDNRQDRGYAAWIPASK